jgi:hypothetical protein
MKSLIVQYCYLPDLDLFATVVVLKRRVKDANPFIASLMRSALSPFTILVAVKARALCLGIYCRLVHRRTSLSGATTLYAGMIAWNLRRLVGGSGTTQCVHVEGLA